MGKVAARAGCVEFKARNIDDRIYVPGSAGPAECAAEGVDVDERVRWGEGAEARLDDGLACEVEDDEPVDSHRVRDRGGTAAPSDNSDSRIADCT